MHWAAQYIGLPVKEGGRGPDAYDCWGLVQLIYRDRFEIELPDLPGANATNARRYQDQAVDWVELQKPQDGCLVAMSQVKHIHHVGIYVAVECGKVIHCWKAQHVIADTIKRLRLHGFRTIRFYRHGLHN